MTDEQKTYTCGICGASIRARFTGPVPVSDLGKPYYEHVEGGAYDHDPERKPRSAAAAEMAPVDDRTPTQREFDRSALQLAMYQNRLDNRESGTVLWPDLDLTARALYLKEAKRTIGALGLLGWAPLNLRGVLYLHERADSLKMLRETLAAAETYFANWAASYIENPETHLARIGRLIAEIDRQRPLGPDGKHGDLHTPSCGCEDR